MAEISSGHGVLASARNGGIRGRASEGAANDGRARGRESSSSAPGHHRAPPVGSVGRSAPDDRRRGRRPGGGRGGSDRRRGRCVRATDADRWSGPAGRGRRDVVSDSTSCITCVRPIGPGGSHRSDRVRSHPSVSRRVTRYRITRCPVARYRNWRTWTRATPRTARGHACRRVVGRDARRRVDRTDQACVGSWSGIGS